MILISPHAVPSTSKMLPARPTDRETVQCETDVTEERVYTDHRPPSDHVTLPGLRS